MSEVRTLCHRAGLGENGLPVILPYDSLITLVCSFTPFYQEQCSMRPITNMKMKIRVSSILVPVGTSDVGMEISNPI